MSGKIVRPVMGVSILWLTYVLVVCPMMADGAISQEAVHAFGDMLQLLAAPVLLLIAVVMEAQAAEPGVVLSFSPSKVMWPVMGVMGFLWLTYALVVCPLIADGTIPQDTVHTFVHVLQMLVAPLLALIAVLMFSRLRGSVGRRPGDADAPRGGRAGV